MPTIQAKQEHRKPMSDTAWEFVSVVIVSVSTGVIALLMAMSTMLAFDFPASFAYGTALGAFGGTFIVGTIGAIIKALIIHFRNRNERK